MAASTIAHACRSLFLASLAIAMGSTACGGATAEETAEEMGGTPPPDGAPGACCLAATGGCAFEGGYLASGNCPTRAILCDNLCDQRIVEGEHGCDVLAYATCPRYAPDGG